MPFHAAMNTLGAVTPNTRAKCQEILDALHAARGVQLATVWGKGGGEHATGRALDLMVFGDTASGDWIADYVWTNRVRLGLGWQIWRQRIRNVNAGSYGPAGRWNPMENRGSSTNNHMDHPHIYFASDSYTPPSGGTPTPSKGRLVVPEINLKDAGNGSRLVTQPALAIKAMQRLLGVTADGLAGNDTRRALGDAQARAQLTVDFIWGPDTASALLDGRA